MNSRFNSAVKVLALAATMAFASSASAQSAGSWMVKAGVNKITPKVESGDVSAPALPHTQAGVKADTKPIFNIAYMVTDNISAELDLGVPYKHELVGAGAIEGTGKLGTVEVLPPTLFAQYRFFTPTSMVRPYLGLGVTYVYYQKETGSGQLTSVLNTGGAATTFSLKSKFALSAQIGTTVSFNERWFADLALIKAKLKTTATYSTGQTQEMTLDPLAVSVSIGYKF